MTKKTEIQFVSPEEYEKILTIVETARHVRFEPWFKDVLEVAWATGCRPAEIVGKNGRPARGDGDGYKPQSNIKEHHGIRARDVLPENMVHVKGKNTGGGRKSHSGSLKPRNVICADNDTYRRLRELAERAPGASAHVFGLGPSAEGPYRDGYWRLYKQVKKLRPLLPPYLADFRVQWLRHAWAINALRAGIDLKSIQQQLGHSDIETTAEYLRFVPFDKQRVINAWSHGQSAHIENRDCPACGFAWRHDTRENCAVAEDRAGAVLRRPRVSASF